MDCEVADPWNKDRLIEEEEEEEEDDDDDGGDVICDNAP
jgi:hypothetical protein